MTFKEGDRVILRPGSRYTGQKGQIVGAGKVTYVDRGRSHPFRVAWEYSGGLHSNVYEAEDLLHAKEHYIQLFKKHYK